MGLGDDELAEYVVDPVNDRSGGAKVAFEVDALGVKRLLGGKVKRNIGSAKTVDALFWVTDKKQSPGAGFELSPVGGDGVGIGDEGG